MAWNARADKSTFIMGDIHVDSTAQRLVDFTRSLQFTDLPDEAITCAKARIISTIAVCLAAYEFPPVQISERVVPDVSNGPTARILGSLKRTSPEMAAFVNSAMVRCLDMSDTAVMAAVTHPADAFPAILAIAEAEGYSGQDLLLATALIYEAQVRFIEVVPYNHHGWDQTPVVAMGAALGVARLMGLSEEQTHHALSLAITPNLALNQTRTGKLSMWKGMAGAARRAPRRVRRHADARRHDRARGRVRRQVRFVESDDERRNL